MGLETGTYISDLVATNPVNATDQVAQGDDHIRLLKSTILATFPAITGAITATHTELNILDGVTATTAEINLLDGVTATTAEINILDAGNTFDLDNATVDMDGTTLTADYTNITVDAATTLNFAGGSATATLSGTEIGLTATTLDFNGAADFSSTVQIAGVTQLGTGTPTISERFAVFSAGATRATLNNTSDSVTAMILAESAEAVFGALTAHPVGIRTSNTERVSISATSGEITTPNTTAAEFGYKGSPVNTQNGDYTLVLTDAGKTIYKASGGAGETITIPANASVAFPVGTIIDVMNDGGGTLSIAITSDTLVNAAGATGTRTIADQVTVRLRKVTSTRWRIEGSTS